MNQRADATPTRWPGRVFLAAGTILYTGPGAVADEHAHHAVQLVWSFGGPMLLHIGGRTIERRAVLIPANESHSLNASGNEIALLLLESHAPRGRRLNRAARADPGRELADHLSTIGPPTIGWSTTGAMAWADEIVAALGSPGAVGIEVSSVSRRAIDHIERGIDGVPRLAEAAAAIGISPTRLTHVFTKEVGVPFRRFVLWTRIKRAVTELQAGGDLTRAAVAAGFTDAAHFSRTFRAMFGLSPSLVLPVAELAGTIWRPR
jgi:AraC-like DNA-binding protein